MTYKEMLERDYPSTQIERVILDLCPEDLGYEDKSPCVCLVGFRGEAAAAVCKKCWSRKASPQPAAPAASREGDLI